MRKANIRIKMSEFENKYKKVKLNVNEIKNKMNKQNFDIDEYKLMKFIFMFKKIRNEQNKENINEEIELVDTDSLVDVLSNVVRNLLALISSNIDSLDKTPQTKRILKIIKSVLNFFNDFKKKEKQPLQNETTSKTTALIEDGKNKNDI